MQQPATFDQTPRIENHYLPSHDVQLAICVVKCRNVSKQETETMVMRGFIVKSEELRRLRGSRSNTSGSFHCRSAGVQAEGIEVSGKKKKTTGKKQSPKSSRECDSWKAG